MPLTIVDQQSAALNDGVTQITFTFSGSVQAGDLVCVFQMDDFYTLSDYSAPTLATGPTFVSRATADGGTNGSHGQVWTATLTPGFTSVITVRWSTHLDQERYAQIFVLRNAAWQDAAGAMDSGSGTNHPAPSVSGTSAGLLLCAWGGDSVATTAISPPGSMTGYTQQDIGATSYRAASEALTSTGATGTRTATTSANRLYALLTASFSSTDTAGGPLPFRPGKTWQRRFHHPQRVPFPSGPVGPQNYQQALTAGLSFTGSLTRAVAYHLTAALSFTGSLLRLIGYHLTAGLSFTGSQIRRVGKLLTAGLSFTGTQIHAIGKLVTAGLSFTGALLRRITKTLTTAVLSFGGSLTRLVGYHLTATLSFAGSMTTAVVHFFTQALSGALSFTGSQTRRAGKALTGVLSFTGSQSRRVGHVIAAGLSFTGALPRVVRTRLAAALSFIGNLVGVNPNAGRQITIIPDLTCIRYSSDVTSIRYASDVSSSRYGGGDVTGIRYSADVTGIRYGSDLSEQ